MRPLLPFLFTLASIGAAERPFAVLCLSDSITSDRIGAINRYQEQIIARKPDLAVIPIGGNDAGGRVDEAGGHQTLANDCDRVHLHPGGALLMAWAVFTPLRDLGWLSLAPAPVTAS